MLAQCRTYCSNVKSKRYARKCIDNIMHAQVTENKYKKNNFSTYNY